MYTPNELCDMSLKVIYVSTAWGTDKNWSQYSLKILSSQMQTLFKITSKLLQRFVLLMLKKLKIYNIIIIIIFFYNDFFICAII